MKSGLHFFLVDDDRDHLEMVATLLECEDHRVTTSLSSVKALAEIPRAKPDCIVLDIMMPEIDGIELCQKLRAKPELAGSKIIVLSAKPYDADKRRAKEVGADAYIKKPIDTERFLAQIADILSDQMTLTFWGVRGTLPVPGPRTNRYGGNTSCVTLEFQNEQLFIFDAGSGIKELSNHIMSKGKPALSAKIFISHPHWDHINALPFFVPLYVPGNEFEILGARHGDITMRRLIGEQMSGVYFPVTMTEFGATVSFRDLGEEAIEVAGIDVETLLLTHPGNCLGYRVKYKGATFCYITDNELFPPGTPYYSLDFEKRLVRFTKGADALIMDCTYFDEEYPKKMTWGHSNVSMVADLAHKAEAKTLYLFHHDPDQKDDDIDRKLELTQKKLAELGSRTKCVAPAEGDRVQM